MGRHPAALMRPLVWKKPPVTGPEVQAAQARLWALGFYQGTVDGVYGPRTYHAVRLFQRFMGLAEDGAVRRRTWERLFSRRILVPGPLYGRALRVTDPPIWGTDVRLIQRALTAEGFAPGPPDGAYGPATSAAVRAFQHAARLAEDGEVGPETWNALLR